jgi:GDP/UDP-N,N'-diacetylbacillosamine 2-epimerase (hydrolysing)|tara:strand:+ start:442 stop:1569 length:1128 start_codon:yes stop_codon:yes gene_type:complete
MKKICFITTSRADFGMVSELIKNSLLKKKINTLVIVSGDHYKDVQKEFKKNLSIIKKVKINENSLNDLKIAISFSDYVKKFSLKLKFLSPDIFVVFGDRYEMLAATLSAYILRIPIAHVAGGEKTAGSLDEGFRHSITKMANLHFPTNEKHKKIIKQLGEKPNTIFNYGSLNELKILKSKTLNKSDLEKKLNIKFAEKNILLTYHPETIEKNKSLTNLKLILNVLKKLKNTKIIVTASNNDSEGIKMNSFIKKFVKKQMNGNFYFKKTLGSKNYFSLLKVVNLMIGNSSSGISEAPFFKVPTINLGNRQRGRTMPKSVINSDISSKAISTSLSKVFKMKFKKNVLKIKKNIAKKIVNQLISFNFKKYNLKLFYDI